MEVIYGSHKVGKTTQLIKQCHEKGGYIVCSSQKACEILFEQSRRMGFRIPYPLTFDEFLDGAYYPPGVQKIYIDNVDLLLEKLTKGEVKIETITIDKKEIKSDKQTVVADIAV